MDRCAQRESARVSSRRAAADGAARHRRPGSAGSRAVADSPRAVAQREAIAQLFAGTASAVAQRAMAEEEEPLQGRLVQRAMEEEEPLQGRLVQRASMEDEELLQGRFASAPAQRRPADGSGQGLPAPLRAGIESLSGQDLSDVRVHRGSHEPAQLGALAYAQGADIHLAPGQDRHLPHEAWHVVQQRQGRVRPTMQRGGTPINDDASLESEADAMGAKAMRQGPATDIAPPR